MRWVIADSAGVEVKKEAVVNLAVVGLVSMSRPVGIVEIDIQLAPYVLRRNTAA